MCLIFGGQYAEGYCVANDLEQAQGGVLSAIKRIVKSSPELRAIARIFSDKIEFPVTGATITALASDYAGAAGANPTISTFDELWGYTSERSRRLWDEMVPPPTRKIACRLTTTYAGFEGELPNFSKNYTSAAWRSRRLATICTPATVYSCSGRMYRSRRGSPSSGSSRCGASYGRTHSCA